MHTSISYHADYDLNRARTVSHARAPEARLAAAAIDCQIERRAAIARQATAECECDCEACRSGDCYGCTDEDCEDAACERGWRKAVTARLAKLGAADNVS